MPCFNKNPRGDSIVFAMCLNNSKERDFFYSTFDLNKFGIKSRGTFCFAIYAASRQVALIQEISMLLHSARLPKLTLKDCTGCKLIRLVSEIEEGK